MSQNSWGNQNITPIYSRIAPLTLTMQPLRTTPLQKLILIASALTFVAIACITAALPVNLPRHQESKGTGESGTENLNSGDTAWMLLATVFGFLVGPLTAHLYGEASRRFHDRSYLIPRSSFNSEHIWKRWTLAGDGHPGNVNYNHRLVDRTIVRPAFLMLSCVWMLMLMLLLFSP